MTAKPQRRRRMALVLGASLLSASLCAALLAAGMLPAADAAAAAAEGPRPPSITVATAATGVIADTVTVTGTLVPRHEVLVSPEIEGLAITNLLAEEGDRVERGQVLARLSRETVEVLLAQNAAEIDRAVAAVGQARSQISEAEATRAQAEAALVRTRTLEGRGNASTETLEQRQANARVAAARVAAAQQALRVAEAEREVAQAQRRELAVRLARTEVRAPADGFVSRRTAKLGALASMAGEPLFRIVGDSAVELEAEVSETTLARLRDGQRAGVLPAGMDREVPGSVRLVMPEVNPTTRLGRVRIALAPPEGTRLAVGSFARGTVEIARREGVLVPLSAVLFRPEGAIVQVVRDGVIETRNVAAGIRARGIVEITAGLATGESVVATAGTFVRDGDRVTPVAASASPLAASASAPAAAPVAAPLPAASPAR
ncbi:efflux RND transporter periplasmic adaptor subunit [Arenibaculum pallidiluteum]|uniref:efflux RND transporter periplasmic adaptor subunit n=1 Tax=Arenibaculum pallidiluteum TaxID=2812559 RepID=UPI001A968CBB|nr:efflux RND transporter periplasmic adaptor subunit [Arenibaculum pallidiluteum]